MDGKRRAAHGLALRGRTPSLLLRQTGVGRREVVRRIRQMAGALNRFRGLSNDYLLNAKAKRKSFTGDVIL